MKNFICLLSIILLTRCSFIHPPVTLESYKTPEISKKEKVLGELNKNSITTLPRVPNSVGVLTFQERGAKTGLGLAATEFFTANLNLIEKFNLIDMSYSTILEQEFTHFSPSRKQQTLKAEQLITGYVNLAGEDLSVSGLDLPRGATNFQMLAMLEGKQKDFFRLVADLNIKFFEKSGLIVTKEVAEKLYQVPTENIEAYILYAKGRHAEYLGNYEDAKQFYQQAGEMEPEFEEPGKATQRVEQNIAEIAVQPAPAVRTTTDIFTSPVNQAPSFEEKTVPPTSSDGKVIINITLPNWQ